MYRLRSDPPSFSSRFRLIQVSCSIVVVSLATVTACGTDAVKEAAIRELAVGSWACAPDAPGSGNESFTVRIEDDGTFGLLVELASIREEEMPPVDEITGTWSVDDGDLEWGIDVMEPEKTVVEGFDSLTLESTGFTLEQAGVFEANDGSEDPAGEQDVIVDAHGPDSVTLSVPEGDPWTCNRQ